MAENKLLVPPLMHEDPQHQPPLVNSLELTGNP